MVLVIAGVVVWPSKVKALFPARAERPAGVDIPSRSEEASDERLLPPVSVAGTPDPSSFGWSTEQDNGSGPVAFDPCRPIHYVTRATDPETRDVSVIHEAVATVSEASGLKFSYDGSTDERPTKGRAPFQRDRYGDRWAPVLIAWTDPTESPELTGYAGLGGGIPWRDTSGRVSYVSGTVWLDTAALHASRREAEGRDRIRALVMHELAHVLGAAHVTDRSQIMAEKGGTTLKLGKGDRYALSVLGQGRCTPGL